MCSSTTITRESCTSQPQCLFPLPPQPLQVLWEAFPSDSVPNASFVDLLLRGMQTEGITSASPRPDTDTWALQFRGDAVVTVVTQEQPTAADINDGFTIRYKIPLLHTSLDAFQKRVEDFEDSSCILWLYWG